MTIDRLDRRVFQKPDSSGEQGLDVDVHETSSDEHDSWCNFYAAPNGKHYGTINAIAERMSRENNVEEIADRTIRKVLSASVPIKILQAGHIRQGYSYEDAASELKDLTTRPRVSDSGEWRNFLELQGEHFGSVGAIASKLDIGHSTAIKSIQDVGLTPTPLRDNAGKKVDGYSYEKVATSFRELFSRPVAESKGEWMGFYVTPEMHYGSVTAIMRRLEEDSLKTSRSVIEGYINSESISGIDIQSAITEPVRAYPYETVRKHIRTLLAYPLVNKEGEWRGFVEIEGKHYGSPKIIARKIDVGARRIREVAKDGDFKTVSIRSQTGEEFHDAYAIEDLTPLFRDFLALPRCELMGEWRGYVLKDGKHYTPVGNLKRKFNVSDNFLGKKISEINAQPIRMRDIMNKVYDGYAFEDAREALEDHLTTPRAMTDGEWEDFCLIGSEHYGPVPTIADRLGVGTMAVSNEIERLKLSLVSMRTRDNLLANGYSFEALSRAMEKYVELPAAEEEGIWKGFYLKDAKHYGSVGAIASRLQTSHSVIRRRISELALAPVSMKFEGARVAGYAYEDLEVVVRTYLEIPAVNREGIWRGFYEHENKHYGAALTLAQKFNMRNSTLLRKVEDGGVKSLNVRGLGNKIVTAYALEDVESLLVDKNQDKLKSRIKESTDEKLLNDVLTQESQPKSQLQRYASLFGSSQTVDLLYATHPEIKGMPVERVKEGVAEYLGNYLFTPAPFSLINLKGAEVHLKNKDFRQGLREVIKNDCLHKVLLKRKDTKNADELELFNEYFADLKTQAVALGSSELDETITEVENYYRTVETLGKSKNIVDSLKLGRAFPDIYQKINIKEISDKRRLLIADEMGVGKSASAILAKEMLDVKTALILVPSNTTETWQSYLSDKVDESGKQIGYFKKGEAPRVFTVEKPDDLTTLKTGTYDYVLISHEKLGEHYMNDMKQLDFGMLIVDEVHKLKNVQEGKRASNLLELSQKIEGEGKYLAMLSGTPVPNKVEDVAMILKLLHPERFEKTENKELVSAIIKGDVLDLRALLVPYMQMKNLGEHIEMPELKESIIEVTLSPQEQDIYQVLLEEDELTPMQKIQELRQFLMNHAFNDITPDIPNSKIEAARRELSLSFAEKDKVAFYVNDYITDVIRGNNSILPQLGLPAGVDIRVVHGNNRESRGAIQDEFNRSIGKMLLAISGETADVGVDYSGGQGILFYNEPWNKAKKNQQEARVFRPGVSGDIESKTLITKGTIEEGMHHYIEAKQRAIEKLLRVLPITEAEREILEQNETVEEDEDLGVNTEFAKYYFSSFDQMNRIFAAVKEMGEKDFQIFLERYGSLYADCYRELGSRSYQGNASRVCAALIQTMAREQGKEKPRILDVASGPEMLRRHSREDMQENIVSMDLNAQHFADLENKGQVIVGSFTKLPVADGSMDYVNLSLALHYSKFVPSRGEYERAHVLEEASRVLKDGGRVVINMIYSLDFGDFQKLGEVAELFGLKMVDEYSGEATSGSNYQSRIVTFEKTKGLGQTVDEIIPNLLKEDWNGLKLRRTDEGLKDSRRIISRFTMGGKEYAIEFNAQDQKLLDAERQVLSEGEEIKRIYGSVEAIPRDEVINRNFVRYRLRTEKRYVLFKKIPEGGVVVIK